MEFERDGSREPAVPLFGRDAHAVSDADGEPVGDNIVLDDESVGAADEGQHHAGTSQDADGAGEQASASLEVPSQQLPPEVAEGGFTHGAEVLAAEHYYGEEVVEAGAAHSPQRSANSGGETPFVSPEPFTNGGMHMTDRTEDGHAQLAPAVSSPPPSSEKVAARQDEAAPETSPPAAPQQQHETPQPSAPQQPLPPPPQPALVLDPFSDPVLLKEKALKYQKAALKLREQYRVVKAELAEKTALLATYTSGGSSFSSSAGSSSSGSSGTLLSLPPRADNGYPQWRIVARVAAGTSGTKRSWLCLHSTAADIEITGAVQEEWHAEDSVAATLRLWQQRAINKREEMQAKGMLSPPSGDYDDATAYSGNGYGYGELPPSLEQLLSSGSGVDSLVSSSELRRLQERASESAEEARRHRIRFEALLRQKDEEIGRLRESAIAAAVAGASSSSSASASAAQQPSQLQPLQIAAPTAASTPAPAAAMSPTSAGGEVMLLKAQLEAVQADSAAYKRRALGMVADRDATIQSLQADNDELKRALKRANQKLERLERLESQQLQPTTSSAKGGGSSSAGGSVMTGLDAAKTAYLRSIMQRYLSAPATEGPLGASLGGPPGKIRQSLEPAIAAVLGLTPTGGLLPMPVHAQSSQQTPTTTTAATVNKNPFTLAAAAAASASPLSPSPPSSSSSLLRPQSFLSPSSLFGGSGSTSNSNGSVATPPPPPSNGGLPAGFVIRPIPFASVSSSSSAPSSAGKQPSATSTAGTSSSSAAAAASVAAAAASSAATAVSGAASVASAAVSGAVSQLSQFLSKGSNQGSGSPFGQR